MIRILSQIAVIAWALLFAGLGDLGGWLVWLDILLPVFTLAAAVVAICHLLDCVTGGGCARLKAWAFLLGCRARLFPARPFWKRGKW